MCIDRMQYDMDLDFWRMQIYAEYKFCRGKTQYESETLIKVLIQAAHGISHAEGMFAKCKISASGDFAALAGAWGVPSQRFRISEKDILKHCWQRAFWQV